MIYANDHDDDDDDDLGTLKLKLIILCASVIESESGGKK
jgi:hypothetical protein